MEPTSIEALLIDGEWESLCGMFNFEKELDNVMAAGDILDRGHESSPPHSDHEHNERALDDHHNLDLSSFYNDDHHHLGGNVMSAAAADDDQNYHVFYSDDISMVSPNGFNGLNRDPVNDLGMLSSLNYDPNKENHRMMKRKLDVGIGSSVLTEKKLRVPRQGNGNHKRSSVGRWKKNQKVVSPERNNLDNNTDNNHNYQNGLMSSDEDENASQEITNTAVADFTRKTKRASKGTATDPQSLYARKRRERINERLKVLQNLVPNGTKVDISTMLEEAVHYVKFLQLQIKLLSSDDLWMYAPLAYNGVDMGLHQRLFSRLV